MTWATPYIGQTHEPDAPFPCFVFARRVQREVFGRELPGILSVARAVRDGGDFDEAYPEIDKPRDGCLVLIGTVGDEAAHVGVWCEQAKMVVHAENGFGSVIASDLWRLRHLWHSVRFYAVPA